MRIFHIRTWFLKHVENSIRGIRKAARLGYDAIDLDMLITSDGVIVACHWGEALAKDRFVDPKHRIQHNALIKHLTWAQVRTLRAQPGNYRIQRIEIMLAACARNKIIAYLEPKYDHRFGQDWPWQHIKDTAAKYGTKVRVYALPDNAYALEPARRVGGFRTRVIGR